MRKLINRYKFFKEYRKQFYLRLKQSQVDGIGELMNHKEFSDKENNVSLHKFAYILATVYHETAHTMQPIKERRAGRWQIKIRRMQDRYWDTGYYGRGYVQLTWKFNYLYFAKKLKIKLVQNPDLALDPEVSTAILFHGMIYGAFTGKKLKDYINNKHIDYVNARRIVNGTFRAKKVAKLAKKFQKCLEEGLL